MLLPRKYGLIPIKRARARVDISHHLRHGTKRVVDLRKPKQSREKQGSAHGQEKLSCEEVFRRSHGTPILRHAQHAEQKSQGDRGDGKCVHKVPSVVEEVPVRTGISARKSSARGTEVCVGPAEENGEWVGAYQYFRGRARKREN